MYEVVYRSSAAREFRKLDRRIARRVALRVEALAGDPRPPDVKKLVNWSNGWSIRVGDYRVIYQIDDGVQRVTVVHVSHRSEAY